MRSSLTIRQQRNHRTWCSRRHFADATRRHPEYFASLRNLSDISAQFAGVKRVLAARFSTDREAYTNAKSPRVHDILRLARVTA